MWYTIGDETPTGDKTMPDMRVGDNKIIRTESLPANVEPIFCCECACRVGWFDNGHGDEGVYYCDQCVADLSNDGRPIQD